MNRLEETKFEKFLARIVGKLKNNDKEIFSDDEKNKLEIIFKVTEDDLVLAIKTIVYLFKRMLKYIFKPTDLKKDLTEIGLTDNKSDFFVRVWSTEIRATLDELGTEVIEKQGRDLRFSWNLNAELSSDINKKSKTPKAYISIADESNVTEMELTHSELYAMFLQFESIQNELDNLM